MKQYYIQSYPDPLNTKVIAIPAFELEDNYLYLLVDDSKNAIIIDPGLAGPVIDVIEKLGYRPTHILVTHSHGDHKGGVQEILNRYPNVKTFDYSNCASDNQTVEFNGHEFDVFKTPGHWADHICFFESRNKILFCGDIVFRFGCGRNFVGTMDELYSSHQKIKMLPVDTDIYCAHEYTQANLAFCLQEGLVNPNDFTTEEKQKIDTLPTLPVKLGVELKYNPFLKAKSVHEFGELRKLRNTFRYQK